ncbi:beta-galactosidase [Flavobacterium sp. GN10]|uniref:Beta-galactosidase n=1 Tax=Flavobacterium tagetis TaxID=2801336 RepID=A0ABS1KIL4_9FLAO|nr:beta-galactosidase [Flavobacterium tagetis]MBL0739319.1 beta-galactosidase [Flavobacterium tagetis]
MLNIYYIILVSFLFTNEKKDINSEFKTPLYAIVRSNISDSDLIKVLEHPHIEGITYYVGWSKLNPDEHIYDFSSLKKILNLAKKHNKKVNFGVLTGRWSPNWLKDKKIKYLYWEHFDDYVEAGNVSLAEAPVPWDKRFNHFFEVFLLKLKIIVDQNEDVLNAIEITGGSNTNGIETNFICSDKEFKRVGFRYSKYIKNWEQIIDTFVKLFPNTVLTLAIHDVYGVRRTDLVSKELIAYCDLKYSERIKIAAFAFSEEQWFSKGNQYADLVLQLHPNDIMLQSIRIYSNVNTTNDSFNQMLLKADKIGPMWLEIWSEDIIAGFLNLK